MCWHHLEKDLQFKKLTRRIICDSTSNLHQFLHTFFLWKKEANYGVNIYKKEATRVDWSCLVYQSSLLIWMIISFVKFYICLLAIQSPSWSYIQIKEYATNYKLSISQSVHNFQMSNSFQLLDDIIFPIKIQLLMLTFFFD